MATDVTPMNRADRRSGAKKTTSKVAAAPAATMNLDELEREEAPEEFSFIHNGRRFVLADPEEMDWRDIVDALGHPELFFRAALAEGDREDFFAKKMEAWKLAALVKRYREHFGLPDPGEFAALSR